MALPRTVRSLSHRAPHRRQSRSAPRHLPGNSRQWLRRPPPGRAPHRVGLQDAQAATPSPTRSHAASLAALANSVAGRNAAAPAQNSAKPQSEYEEQNMQAHKESFSSSARGSQSGDYLPSTRTPPLTQYAIQAGWEIPAVLEQAINSDLPGELKALVMSNVYDTPTGRFLLIPQGSRLIGLYDSHVGYAQDGVQVVWNRIIYPDGSSLDLNGMMGLDSHGNAGLRYEVDHHYKRLVGFAVLTSVFTAAFELSQSRGQSTTASTPSTGQMAGGAVGQEVSQLGEPDHAPQSQHAAHHQDPGRLQVQRAREPRHPLRRALRATASRAHSARPKDQQCRR